MATPIVIHPQDKSPIVIKGGDKESVIRVDESINWNRVEAIVADAVREAVKNVSVDDQLSSTSTNAVQNKVIYKKIEEIEGVIDDAISDAWDEFDDINNKMYKGVPVVNQTGSATIAPNVWNSWGSVAALTITKGTDVEGIVNNYMIRFTASASTSVVFVGFSIQWYGGSVPTWTNGNTYEISIVDNVALWAEIEPTA